MELQIEYLSPDEIKPYENNAKLHPAEQVEQIKKSIEQFGFNDPVAIWKDNVVIEGHGRLIAALELGLDSIPVIRLDGLTDQQRKAYTLAHNKLTMNTGFDADLLQMELDDILDFYMPDFGFDVVADDGADTQEETKNNFTYEEQYGVIVMCADEKEQEKIYNRLTEEGLSCKVVAV